MRLLTRDKNGELRLMDNTFAKPPRYAILSHTWGDEEVTFADIENRGGKSKAGYRKTELCTKQAERDGLQYI